MYVMGGTGGNGLEKHGGVGGKGGDVWVVPENLRKGEQAQASLKALKMTNFSQRWVAGNGGHSACVFLSYIGICILFSIMSLSDRLID